MSFKIFISTSKFIMSKNSTPVFLYVYDLSQGMAKIMSQQLVGKYVEGIWHTAVVAFGKEIYFQSGVEVGTPRQTMFGVPVKEILIGETELALQDLLEIVDSLRGQFTAQNYHVFDNNCNHFCNELLQLFMDKNVP